MTARKRPHRRPAAVVRADRRATEGGHADRVHPHVTVAGQVGNRRLGGGGVRPDRHRAPAGAHRPHQRAERLIGRHPVAVDADCAVAAVDVRHEHVKRLLCGQRLSVDGDRPTGRVHLC